MIDKVHILKEVNKLLALPFVSGKFPIPVEKIFEHYGFKCYLFTPNAKTIDISGAVNHRTKQIFINNVEPPQRQLFTVAHEIGHIILHGAQADYIDYRGGSSEPKEGKEKEEEANYFAANLLMPEAIFRWQWQENGQNLTEVAQFFGVSTTAAAIRANSLGLA